MWKHIVQQLNLYKECHSFSKDACQPFARLKLLRDTKRDVLAVVWCSWIQYDYPDVLTNSWQVEIHLRRDALICLVPRRGFHWLKIFLLRLILFSLLLQCNVENE